MDALWADDYVNATYRHPEIPNPVHLFVPFYAYQATEHTAHAPQACMLGGGWTMKDAADRSIQPCRGPLHHPADHGLGKPGGNSCWAAISS